MILYVRGKVNVGGFGFVLVIDIVIVDEIVLFSFFELLFGLYLVCVLLFLVCWIGW